MSKLDARNKKILWAVIESYIAHSGPVGSRALTKKYSLGLSPATIRNSMADLEESGYVIQPHTSAGRIPTVKGYRLYVDTLLKEYASSNKVLLQHLTRLHTMEENANRLIKEASRTLSTFSRYLGIAIPPIEDETTLKRIELIKHGRNKVLGILISEEGIIKNKIIVLEEKTFTQKQLDKIARYLNNELTGLTLGEVRTKILFQISHEKKICDNLIINALELCKTIVLWEAESSFNMEGISGACNLPDFATMKQIKEIFRAIEDKHLMIRLLDKIADSKGVQVFIGSENILSEMKDLSLVASTYNVGKRSLGTIGVIGPIRMDYGRVIPIVDHTAKTITQILSARYKGLTDG